MAEIYDTLPWRVPLLSSSFSTRWCFYKLASFYYSNNSFQSAGTMLDISEIIISSYVVTFWLLCPCTSRVLKHTTVRYSHKTGKFCVTDLLEDHFQIGITVSYSEKRGNKPRKKNFSRLLAHSSSIKFQFSLTFCHSYQWASDCNKRSKFDVVKGRIGYFYVFLHCSHVYAMTESFSYFAVHLSSDEWNDRRYWVWCLHCALVYIVGLRRLLYFASLILDHAFINV